MTKALKNLHENLVAITFLIKNMSSTKVLQSKRYQMFDLGQYKKKGSSSVPSIWRLTTEQAYY